ncbi:MAG TPA: tripartite tricarboxylate transporter TctB family protein [Casimicrobiaceae bacterium]|nr:tripartite tricarboxylate transporter TctB family protein [Casimicrobiaceae bacterium]
MLTRLRKALPYFIVLAIAGVLFVMANRIDFSAPGGRIGPDFWPKVILGLATVTCVYQIVKTLFWDSDQVAGVLESILEETPAETAVEAAPEPRYPRLILAGIALTIAYVVLIEYVGFFLSTFVYLAGFAWIGRYRRAGVVIATALIGSLAFMYMFMKVVYVSLPLGQGPFAQVTFFLMRVMNIK